MFSCKPAGLIINCKIILYQGVQANRASDYPALCLETCLPARSILAGIGCIEIA